MKAVPLSLDCCHVLLGQRTSGKVTPPYVEGMLEKECQYSTWVTEGVALPHGTNAALAGVLQDRESVEGLCRAAGEREVLRILAACEEELE
jgi:mannitol/fructose-specific phosphotransferase system IIA component